MAYGYGSMEENIMELAKQGPNRRQNMSSLMAAINANKLATKRYKTEQAEDTRRWQTEYDRLKELDALNEELSRANLALNQATSTRADTSAEMGRIGTYYPYATTEAREKTRQDLISRGLLPESLLKETMTDPTKAASSVYPSAQAGLYPSAVATTAGLTAPATRIVNAPAGTQVNPMQDAYLQLALLRSLMEGGKSGNSRTSSNVPNKNVNFATGKTQTVQPYSGPYISESEPTVWTALGGKKTLKQYGY